MSCLSLKGGHRNVYKEGNCLCSRSNIRLLHNNFFEVLIENSTPGIQMSVERSF
jgi:hypothetical protein